MKFNSNRLLLLIIVLAAFLRFWGLGDLTLMHDELSAWDRLHFNSLDELIEKGVMTDGHPLLVQVFLYFWTSVFGDAEWIMKLPFILCGIASVYVVYLIGRKWFHYSAGLYSAAFLATLQYPILYSQIARPYASGLFLVLLFAYAWGEILLFRRYDRKIVLLYIFTAVLCGLNHHFSALTALIIGLSGFFFIERKKIAAFLLINFTVLLLYLPSLPVTLAQMKYGGVGGSEGWLEPPRISFILDYFLYTFQFSRVVLAGVIAGTIYFAFTRYKNYRTDAKRQILLLLWFSSVFMAGYLYSVLVNPVLQYSVLIFVFPFMLLFLFSFWRIFPIGANAGVIILFCALNVFSLFYFRQHYKLMAEQPYYLTIATAKKWNDQFSGQEMVLFTRDNPSYLEYYTSKLNTGFPVIHIPAEDNGFTSIADAIDSLQPEMVMLGNFSYAHSKWMSGSFPYRYEWKKGFNFDGFIFSKHDKVRDTPDPVLDKKSICADTAGCEYDGISEWGPGIKFTIDKEQRSSLVLATIDCISSDTINHDALLVLTISENDSVIDWRAVSVKEQSDSSAGELYLSMRMKDVIKPAGSAGELEIHAYFWNRNNTFFKIRKLSVELIEDNKLVYGLYEEIR